MEKVLEALARELAPLVAKHIAENHENMLEFLKVNPSVDLEDHKLNEHIRDIASDVFEDKISQVEISIDASLRT